MYTTTCNNEAVIRLVGRLALEFPEIDQLRARSIIEEVLYKYDVVTRETALVTSDLEEKLHMYLAVKKMDGLSDKTLKNYNYEILRFGSFMKKPLSTVTTTDLRIYLISRCQGIKESSANSIRSYLASFFKWLQNEKYNIDNPMASIKKTKQPKRVREPLSEEEVELLRQACKGDREAALLEFCFSTGARLSEIANVNVRDINWHEKSLKVIGKGNKEREIYFSTKAMVLLRNYLKSRKVNSEALFITERAPYTRMSCRAIQKVFKKIAKRTEIHKSIYPHIFRHTFATFLLDKGVPIHIVQALLGHENSATTQIYARTNRGSVMHAHRLIS